MMMVIIMRHRSQNQDKKVLTKDQEEQLILSHITIWPGVGTPSLYSYHVCDTSLSNSSRSHLWTNYN